MPTVLLSSVLGRKPTSFDQNCGRKLPQKHILETTLENSRK